LKFDFRCRFAWGPPLNPSTFQTRDVLAAAPGQLLAIAISGLDSPEISTVPKKVPSLLSPTGAAVAVLDH
jgi:hypothetical protein